MKLVVFMSVIAAFAFGSTGWAQSKSKRSSSKPTSTYTSTSSESTWSPSFNTRTHEVDVNLSVGEIYSHKVGDDSYTDLNFMGSYNRIIRDQIQAGALVGFTTYRIGDDSKSLMTLIGTATYNFDRDLERSLFAQVGIGMAPAYDKDDNEYASKVSFFVGGGKRFEIFDRVSYKPMVRIEKRGSEDTSFRIIPLNIALQF